MADDLDQEYEQVKLDIHAILTSLPRPVSFHELSKDYLKLVGKRLDYSKFGYDTIDDFYWDMEDTVQVPTSP